ncbi:tryptophan halogenase family protein [Caulobacter sp.]|uniref:tryptophan halogenase family protein n=1 Tax=Caulobacter sp. TaxID=78 RepID=UPI003BAB57C7
MTGPSPALPLGRVAIFGGGVEAWMTAAGLARATGGQAAIRVVETGPAPTGALSTLPALRSFHALLGLDEAALMAAARATYKLGSRFSGWTPGASHCDAFGEIGASLEGVGFHHYWNRLRLAGQVAPLDDYSLAATAAILGRFSPPSPDPRSPLSTLAYGLHLDAGRYVAVLRELALRGGVTATRGEIRDVARDGQTGDIEAVVLEDGERVAADLFVDCTGPSARLIGQALAEPFEDWSDLLPADRVVRIGAEARRDAPPLTEIEAAADGWRWRIPLRDRLDSGLVYRGDLTGDEAALRAARVGLPKHGLSEPQFLSFRNGRRARSMVRNCVAIGGAAGVVEAIDASDIHLIQSGVTRLIALFPRSGGGVAMDEYNRLGAETIERVRDLAILHYRLAQRRDGAIWDLGREGAMPEKLAYKLTQFESRGRVVMYDEETFLEPSWIAAFIGHGVTPGRHDPLADRMPLEKVRATLERMRTVLRQTAERLPTHAEALARMADA